MALPRIDLVYFEGCPNAAIARENLKRAIEAAGRELTWSEWDLMSEATPDSYRRYGSPTVLVNGEDVTGDGAHATAMACRADGAPGVEAISARLEAPI